MKAVVLVVFCVLVAACEGNRQTTYNNNQLLARAVTGFSRRLYQQVALNESNVAMSALSAHSVLSLVLLGADNTTATEISTSLGYNVFTDNSVPHQTYQDVITQLNNASGVIVYTANAIFINPDRQLESQYVTQAEEYYLAKVAKYNPNQPGGPETEINTYVKNQTHDQIVNLLPPRTITKDTVAILINTVFFNGTWLRQFSEEKTTLSDFFTRNQTIQLPTVHDDRTVNIKRNILGADVAELPFVNDRFSLYIALPRDVNGLPTLERALARHGAISKLFTNLEPTRVSLSIPKFRIESTFQLKSALQKLGIRDAFDVGRANFQGLSNSGNVYISEVTQKAVIEFTEKGTIAAAATAIIISTTSLQQPPTEFFTADRPFLVFIRDKEQELLLFQAKFSG